MALSRRLRDERHQALFDERVGWVGRVLRLIRQRRFGDRRWLSDVVCERRDGARRLAEAARREVLAVDRFQDGIHEVG